MNTVRKKSIKCSETLRKLWSTPDFREKRVALMRAAMGTPEHRAKISASVALRWRSPEYKEKVRAIMLSPERLKKWKASLVGKEKEISEKQKKIWSNLDRLEARAVKCREALGSSEVKQRLLDYRKKTGKYIVNLPKYSAEHPRAVHVKLRDPNNRVWEVHSLTKFVEEHLDLFEPKHIEFNKKGHRKAISMLSKLTDNSPRKTASGWTLVSATEVFYNNGEDLLERQQYEVHSI